MHEILIEKTLAVPASNLWAILERFSDLSWYSPAESVEKIGDGIGEIRRIKMAGMDAPVDEQLEMMDAANMTFAYSIPGTPMQNYKVVAKLRDNAGQTDVRWHATFESVTEGLGIKPEDMVAMMTDAYSSMFAELELAAA